MTVTERALGPLLEIKGIKTHFFTQDGMVKAVDDVTFEIGHGQTLGVVGESGCGKSITSLSVMRLIERPGRIVTGEILLNGEDLLAKSDADMRDIRGDQVSMIFQEPMTSLNPVFTCGDQIAEAVQQHTAVSRREAWDRAVEMLRVVGIPDAKRRAQEHPHQLSGGMRQRVMIAMALSTDPDLLIADEPTTALDVTIQAQILEVMRDLRAKNRMAIMLITHDLGRRCRDGGRGGRHVRREGRGARRRAHRVRLPPPSVHAGAAALHPAHRREASSDSRSSRARFPRRSTCRPAACSSGVARTGCACATRRRRTRRSGRTTSAAAG